MNCTNLFASKDTFTSATNTAMHKFTSSVCSCHEWQICIWLCGQAAGNDYRAKYLEHFSICPTYDVWMATGGEKKKILCSLPLITIHLQPSLSPSV